MKAVLKIQKEKENVLRQYIIVFYASHLVFGGWRAIRAAVGTEGVVYVVVGED